MSIAATLPDDVVSVQTNGSDCGSLTWRRQWSTASRWARADRCRLWEWQDKRRWAIHGDPRTGGKLAMIRKRPPHSGQRWISTSATRSQKISTVSWGLGSGSVTLNY